MLNRIQLQGNLGADAQSHSSPNGRGFTTFRLATNREFKDRSGNTRSETQWHSAIAWNGVGEFCADLRKGEQVFVEGELTYQTKEDVTYANIRVVRCHRVAPRPQQEAPESQPQPQPQNAQQEANPFG